MNHSTKSILARGCDPVASSAAALAIPPLIGNPEYVATTNDEDFVKKLQSRDWSIVFFAPGACRSNAAKQPIPGSNSQTQRWTLQQYRELIHKHQGNQIQIIETPDETQTVELLKEALMTARDTHWNTDANLEARLTPTSPDDTS